MNTKFDIFGSARRTGLVLAGALLLSANAAMACDLSLWNGGTGGSPLAAQPDNISTPVERYSGLCGMQSPSAAVSYVQDNSPGGISRIRARFYVLNQLDAGESGVIYRGYSSTAGSGNLFTVFLNAAGNVTLLDNASGQTVVQGGSTNWLSVEIDWSQGAGDGVISLSVNGQASVSNTALSNTGNGLQSVRLGNIGGASGTLTFDAYESRRTTEIGRLLACNADPANEQVDILDALAVVNEINEAGLATGQPDCDENGSVDVLDVLAIINIINT